MSYYFAIIGTKDNPLFEHEFGTSKHGQDGQSRFREDARHMNQFIVHSSLDIVEEVQWGTGQMYLKHIDQFQNTYIYCFLTAGNVKFLLLTQPLDPSGGSSLPTSASLTPSTSTLRSNSTRSSYTFNPTAPVQEESTRNFFNDVYEAWVKTIMNPFWSLDAPVKSPVFRARVAAAAKKYL